MREIGGYIELGLGSASALHPAALALNCGRNCLAYLIEARHITHILLPDLLCDSVAALCSQMGVKVREYRIGTNFEPEWDFLVGETEYLYLVDYYGQLDGACVGKARAISGGRLIVDETHALFREPWPHIDTLYSPRKFLGVPDGGYLYTDVRLSRRLPRDESSAHAGYLLGRVERGATAFYQDSKDNNKRFAREPIKQMSLLTQRLIGQEDLAFAVRRREENWDILASALDSFNPLCLHKPKAPYVYPMLVKDGPALRIRLAKRGVYVPTLWPNVVDGADANGVAYEYASNILPLPVDQRYGAGDMEKVVQALRDEAVIPLELTGKKIAILGGTRISCEIVLAAKELGLHTTVIDYNPPDKSPAKQISDAHVLISVADVDEVVAYLREHEIDGVTVGYSDSILGYYADICEKAGLPCYGTRQQFETFTDKRLWKALCRRFGVPTAREYQAEELDTLSSGDLPLPLFVKPSDASGARGTSVVRSREELNDAVARARSFAKNGEVIIEDYLEGPEVTVFWLFIDGEYRVFLIGNRLVKHNQKGVIPLPAGYTFPASVTPRYLEEVAPRVCALLASQEVRDGMMFMQCIVKDGLPFVYDVGYRLTGSLEQHITKATAGYSPMDMLIHHAVTGRMTDDPNILTKIDAGMKAYCYNISCLMRPGTIGHFEGLDVLDADDTVVAYVKAHVEGETLPPEAKGELRQIALRVLGSVDELRDLEDTMLRLQDAVHIVSPEGDELMLPGLEPQDFVGNVLILGGVSPSELTLLCRNGHSLRRLAA